jgi:hypothetical protein
MNQPAIAIKSNFSGRELLLTHAQPEVKNLFANLLRNKVCMVVAMVSENIIVVGNCE